MFRLKSLSFPKELQHSAKTIYIALVNIGEEHAQVIKEFFIGINAKNLT